MPNNEPDSSSQFKKSSSIGRASIDPKRLAQNFLFHFDEWRFSRAWSTVIVGIAPLILMLFVFVVVVWGKTVAANGIVKDYIEAAEQAAPVKEDGTGADEELKLAESQASNEGSDEEKQAEALKAKERKELAEYAFLLYRRVLDKETNNKRALYYVAAQIGERGNLTDARTMMNTLAPDESEGYPAAHAWKAYDLLRKAQLEQQQVDKKLLEHHLGIASKWGGTSPQLLIQRARMLEAEGKTNQALATYSIAADRDPNVRLVLAEAFRRHNQPSRMQQAIDSALSHFSKNLNTEEEKTEDRLNVAQAHLVANDITSAIKVLEEGLVKRDNKDEYRRAISQVLRLSYLNSAKVDKNQFSANLMLLDRAIEVDPANPELQAEINRLTILLGQPGAIDASLESLNKQLADANSPLVCHLLLANLYYLEQDAANAQLHWQIALDINPGIVLALRSYALSLAVQPEPNFDKAIELIDKAKQASKNSPDTLEAKGEILLLMKRSADAAAEFEGALAKAQPLVTVPLRQKLIKIYDELGESDKANRERKIVELIQAKTEELKAKQAAAASNNPSTATAPSMTLVPDQAQSSSTPTSGAEQETAPEKEAETDLESLIRDLQNPAVPPNQPPQK